MINQYRYIVTLPYQLAHALILHHCFRSKLRGNALCLIIGAFVADNKLYYDIRSVFLLRETKVSVAVCFINTNSIQR